MTAPHRRSASGPRRAAALLGAALLALPGCALTGARRAAPVPAEASAAFAEAQELLRAGDPARLAGARAACERALALAPDWIAPRRQLDELLRVDLRAIDALAAYRDALATGSGTPADLYLAGRLEGAAGEPLFERAAAFDPTLAWAWHGLAYSAAGRRDLAAACRFGERALDCARDPWERSFFTATLARFETARGSWERALARLEARLAEADTSAADRAALAVQAALVRLAAPKRAVVEEGRELGLDLLRTAPLSDAEVRELAAALRRRAPDGDAGRVALALAAQPGPLRDRLRAEILLEDGPSPLALGLLERASAQEGGAQPAGALVRAARFAAGDFRGAVEQWLRDLPAVVRAPDGLPVEPSLRAVVERALALPAAPDAAALADLGAALVRAGWFREARAVASALARLDLDAAADLDARALAGTQLLAGIERALSAVDEDGAATVAATVTAADLLAPGGGVRTRPEATLDGLDRLLAALAPHVAQVRALRGEPSDPALVRDELLASPRLEYAGVAEIVHPGPRFSEADERDGLGRAGDPVGGLAGELRAEGRFAIFGALAGDGPDATVLPLLAYQERAGEHLGVAFRGTVAWCEGADVPSRAGRRGARIAGAALHEGYWIDVDAVRGELATWEALAQRFADAPARVDAALSVGGLAVDPGPAGARERTSTAALLDEAGRVRLAVLRERGAAAGALGAVTLDELLAAAALHEEGHLLDRVRHLPIASHLGAALLFLLDVGFSPEGVAQELEYRAELTALCCADDPRFVLAQVLDAVQVGSGVTPHAAAYARLLDDLLAAFDRGVARGAFPQATAARTLVHQLHRLSAEDVRAIALDVARLRRLD